MAYLSLYRKYRPQTFAEVVGQNHVTQTLINAIAEERLHHAYLFTGPRGTGKTSTARILAKAVNCEKGPTPTPCGTCDQCEAITAGNHVDVIELDMASHGGVDDARELRERALFAPVTGRRKVYILDEVHMASTAAFNALLKLVEEPPAHVLFTMATTDPQKVLPTIMSRVQRLDLRRVSAAAVAGHVRDLVGREERVIDDEAVEAVVRAGDGSVRDTLSILEQVLAFGGASVTGEDVGRVLGRTPVERVIDVVDRLAAGDTGGALALVQDLLDDGHDLRRFALDLAGHLRDLLVLQAAPDRPDLVDATAERRARIVDQAGRVPRELVLLGLERVAEALVEMRQAPPRLPLELALARTATVVTAPVPAPAVPVAAPAAAPAAAPEPVVAAAPEPVVEAAPEREPEPEPVVDAAPEPDPVAGPTPAPVAAPSGSIAEAAPEPAPDVPAAGGDVAPFIQRWGAVLDDLRERSMRVHAIFSEAVPHAYARGTLTLAFQPRHAGFHAEEAKKGAYADTLKEAVKAVLEVDVGVDTTVLDEDGDLAPVAGGAGEAPSAAVVAAAADEEIAVAEAEHAPPADDEAAAQAAAELLERELDAEPVE